MATAVAEATQDGAFSLVGGGDSVAAVNQFGYTDKVSYVSQVAEQCLNTLKERYCPVSPQFSKAF